MANSIADILGSYPDPTAATFKANVMQVRAAWLAACPINRSTTYYFDSVAGNDSNDGLSTSSPKQTIAAMNALAGNDVALKIKRGSFYRTATTILDVKGGSASPYGTGTDPIFCGFTQTIASGGSAWTLATGNRYTTTAITACGWLREQGTEWGKVYRRVTSTAEVEATELSWYNAGGVLHVNAGAGVNPNTIAWEATPSTTAAEYPGIIITASGGRVDGMITYGQGLCDEGLAEQVWGVNSLNVRDDGVACITNCRCYYHARHNIGSRVTTGGSGGRCLLEGCDIGWALEDLGYLSIAVTDTGGQEFIAYNCTASYGALPTSTSRNSTQGTAFYGHTTGGASELIEAFYIIDCSIPEHEFAPSRLWHIGDLRSAGGDLTQIRGVAYGCSNYPNFGSAQLVGVNSTATISCDWYINPAVIPTNPGALTAVSALLEGLILSSKVTFSLVGTTVQTSARGCIFNPTTSTFIQPYVSGCHFHLIGNGTNSIMLFNYDLATSGATSGPAARCHNSIWTATGMSATTASTGLGNSASTTSTNNARFGMNLTGTAPSFTNWANTVDLAGLIDVNDLPESVVTGGLTTAPVVSYANLDGDLLATPGRSIGPYDSLLLSTGIARYNIDRHSLPRYNLDRYDLSR